MKIFHRHNWKLLTKIPMASAFDQMKADAKDVSANSWPVWAFRRKVVFVMQCEHCGKLKVYDRVNPA